MWNWFKEMIVSVLKNITSFVLTALLIVASLYLLIPQITKNQTITNAIPTALPAVSTPITYGDALNTYQNIASSAIQASERAMNSIMWIVGAMIALSTGAAGVGAYLYRTARDTSERAREATKASAEAKIAATEAKVQLDLLKNDYSELFGQYKELFNQFTELKLKTKPLHELLNAWEKGEIPDSEIQEAMQLSSWHKWIKDKNDIGWFELAEIIPIQGLNPKLRSLLRLELEKIEKEKKRSKAVQLHKKRLMSLLDNNSDK